MASTPEPVLSQSQKSQVNKALKLESGDPKIRLDTAVGAYLIGIIAQDLGLLDNFPEYQDELSGFYASEDIEALRVCGVDFYKVAARLFAADRDADTYFSCLVNIHNDG